jgi:hypothetical protein
MRKIIAVLAVAFTLGGCVSTDGLTSHEVRVGECGVEGCSHSGIHYHVLLTD